MKKRNWGLFLAVGALLSSKGVAWATPPTQPDSPDWFTEAERDSLLMLLQQFKVSNEDYFRNVLYSWTTPAQVRKIEKGKKTLIKGRGPQEVSFYEKSLSSKRFRNHPLAKVLKEKQFFKKRFAWPHAWPICHGEKDYGHQLLKITLKDEALICRINPFYPGLTQIIDQKGTVIPMDSLEAIKDRIAAVYYINDKYTTKRMVRTNFSMHNKYHYKDYIHQEEQFYREYVIVNENMIASTEYEYDAIIEKIEKELEFLKLVQKCKLRAQDISRTYFSESSTYAIWGEDRLKMSQGHGMLEFWYFYALAFPDAKYDLGPLQTQELINTLKAKLDKLKEIAADGP